MSRITIGEWAERWMAAQVHLKPRPGIDTATSSGGRSSRTGGLRLAEVTHADVVVWVAGLQADGYAASTLRQAHRVLSLTLTLAVRDRRLSYNPAGGRPAGQECVGRSRSFLAARAGRQELARACSGYELLIRLLAYTGLRSAQATALQVRRFRLRHVEGSKSSGPRSTWAARSRMGPRRHTSIGRCRFRGRSSTTWPRKSLGEVPTILCSLLLAGRRFGTKNFRARVFGPAAAAIGVAELTPHALRHTAASLAGAGGCQR